MKRILYLLLALSLVLFCGMMLSCSSGGGGGDDDDEGSQLSYLCFTANADSSSITTKVEGAVEPLPALEYSTDGENWADFVVGDTKVSLNKDEKVYLRAKGTNDTFSKNVLNFIYFAMEGSIAASGSIMSLLDSTCQSKEIPCDCCFVCLFGNCSSLTSAPVLPATTLADGCYMYMFEDCSSLTSAPALPAMTLADYCYESMFAGCSSLTSAPVLPATTLADDCYIYMFEDCSSLTSVEVAFTYWNVSGNSTFCWLAGVSSTGTFTCPSGFDTSTRDVHHIPSDWTVVTK
ncbi:MAG: hypothetical protein MJ215_02755 [Spirochaetia bacterium]|nr:hypothetical protein [Spirochaetia bacterium]